MCIRYVERFGAIFLLTMFATAEAADRPAGPLPASAELQTFRLADKGLSIELVASEPAVTSPVAIAWDEHLRMFVAEMNDYPAGPTSGRIRMLEDVDRDGRYEKSTVFASALPFPTSVLPWNGGVLVTAAPDILFFRDIDGDGKADERRVILTGFGEGNQQLRVNGLSMGLDNWVYGANGRSDGAIRRPQDPSERALLLRHRDFRFRPATGEVEAIGGFSQFGLPRDDWGNRFPSWNTIPIRHVVIEERALSRNPYLAESSSVADILDPRDGHRVFAISPPQVTFNRESVTTFNASCGPTIYRGDALGDGYAGNAFVCESLTNLVHRRVLRPSGATFTAVRVEQNQEFLASTDAAFRPVNLTTGPDGALYVVDFYREMVEHPQFVPRDARSAVDFRKWSDRGRIWRIRASQTRPNHGVPAPATARAAELVAFLGHANGWWRDTAQRLLIERQSTEVVARVKDVATHGDAPLARLHALWTLEGLNALTNPEIAQGLRDPDPGLREAAARLTAGRIELADDLIALGDDPTLRVRFAAAVALGDISTERAIHALAKIAGRDFADPWMRLAVLSGLGDSALPFLQDVVQTHPDWLSNPPSGASVLLVQIGSIVGARHRAEELTALGTILTPDRAPIPNHGRIALLAGVTEGLVRAGESPRDLLLKPALNHDSLARGTSALLDSAQLGVGTHAEPPEDRARALSLLAKMRGDAVVALIPGLLDPAEPGVIQSAAARAMADIASADLGATVLEHWPTLAITTRRDVLASIASSPALAVPLLGALENGTVSASELDNTARAALDRLGDPQQRQRAAAILAKAAPAPRGEVVRGFQSAVSIPADGDRGALLFAKNCQTCHERQGKGHRVGPDLSSLGSRPASALLNDILDPNRDLAPDFVTFLLVTKQGKVFSGLLIEETATSLKLKRADAVEDTILRSEVAELRSSGRSLMPEGLEQSLGVQGLADLIAFLRRP